MRMKYIVVDDVGPFNSNIGYFIFPEFEDHAKIADKIGKRENILGAGFISFTEPDGVFEHGLIPNCYGESVSLGIGVGENDEKIISTLIND